MRDQKTENVKQVGGNAKRDPHAMPVFNGPVQLPTALPVARVAPDSRHERVAEAAYYAAERRGFAAGSELDDWLLAERQIDAGGK